MLSDAVLHATLPASDIERAKKFYGGVLGLEMVDENETTIEYRCGNGTVLFVYPSMYAGKNEATAAEFEVRDLEATKEQLEQQGVRFEEYEIEGLKSDRGIMTLPSGAKVCWFKDSENNILSMTQRVSA